MNKNHGNQRSKPWSPIPDRWENYTSAGNRIAGTRFICMKVPLKVDLCRHLAAGVETFTPAQMVEIFKSKGLNIRLLIDLTNTDRYYDKKEIRALGVQYEKIYVKGHEVPDSSNVKRFCEIVDQFEKMQGIEEADDSIVIGVHCTHGINRTGYLVCRYLIDRKGWSVEKAIDEFNKARGHNMERENYLEALRMPVQEVANSADASIDGHRRNPTHWAPEESQSSRFTHHTSSSTRSWDRQVRDNLGRGQHWPNQGRQHFRDDRPQYGNRIFYDHGWSHSRERRGFDYDCDGRFGNREDRYDGVSSNRRYDRNCYNGSSSYGWRNGSTHHQQSSYPRSDRDQYDAYSRRTW